jgi:hypothetical protein
VVEMITVPASASDRNFTMDILFITFPQFCDKPQTQKLSDVGTVKKKRLS